MNLILADGTQVSGVAFGGARSVAGEVVFNTGMTGYLETLTDPSYRGQILVLTYPLVGNYGIPPPRPAGSIDGPYESDRIQIQGLVVQHYVDAYSHRSAARSLASWLRDQGVPAISGVDTRALTRRLRSHGTMRGRLIAPGHGRAACPVQTSSTDAAYSVDMKSEVFRLVAPSSIARYPGVGPRIMLVDVGAKDQIVRSLLSRGASVVRVPWYMDLLSLVSEVDGIVIGNGPGDPSDLQPLVQQVRTLLASSFSGPIFGICLGNQILALAAGAATYKLLYGHRGQNQPVYDLLTRRSYITSQNHGFAVVDATLPPDWEPWFVNINDGSNEGIRSRTKPWAGVQFHPEGKPGPTDTGFLFDDFLRLARGR